jgi:Spy/CpxP family protein refolding chaperone
MHQMRGAHEEMVKLLTAPTIDRAAIEQARQANIAALDRSSKAMVSGLADAAQVLTPDQRSKVALLIAARDDDRGPGGKHGGWGRHGDWGRRGGDGGGDRDGGPPDHP